MSILIKGIDMPKIGKNVEHVWVPGWIEVGKDGKAIFCTGIHFDPNTIHSYPIEEVPTPHGRLIDADRLIVALKNSVYANAFFRDPTLTVSQIEQLIEHQPTIIKAEE